MKLIFYSQVLNKTTEQIKEFLKTLVPQHKFNYFQTPQQLSYRLSKPQVEQTVLVFFAKDKEDLKNVISLRKLLQNLRNILILPDRKQETIRLGHQLYPRFLAFADDDFEIPTAVLRKMIKTQTLA